MLVNPLTGGGINQAFTSQTSVTVNHNFGAYPNVDVMDHTGAVLVPLTITHSSVNAFTVTFSSAKTGVITAAYGGRGSTVGTFVEEIAIALGDETTAITTGTAKVTWHMTRDFTLLKVKAGLTTASSSGTPTFNVKDDGVSVFTTKLTIDANEKFSDTAAVPSVLTSPLLLIASGSLMTVDIDVAGTGATGAKIYLIGYATGTGI